MQLLFGLSSLFSQNSRALLKNCEFIVVPFKELTKNMLFDCFGVRSSPHFFKSQTFKMAKSRENRTNMDIILLANPLNKHRTTPVHITYSPLEKTIYAEMITVETTK